MLEHLLSSVPNKHFVVLSGGFGRMVAGKIDAGEISYKPYILFKGGIRSGNAPEIIRKTTLHGNRSLFIDDSIYGGGTYYAIRDFLRKNMKIEMTGCLAVYDGCPIKKDYVKSLFRYYDHYKATPNYQF